MRILLATDFSEPSRHAADLAAGLARRMNAGIVLAHVAELPTMAYPDLLAVDFARIEASLQAGATARLKEEGDRLRALGLVVEHRLLDGHPPERLAEVAGEVGAQLIVVGTHGRRAVPRFFLGSVAERVVLAADRPVLVARAPEGGDDVFKEWTSGSRALRLTVAVDDSPTSRAAIEWVRRLRALTPCDITFVHLYWPPSEYARLGLVGQRSLAEPDAACVRVLERELGDVIGQVPGEGRTTLRILPSWGEPGSHLAAIASETQADLLVMGTHRRRGIKRLVLGATTQPTLHAATVPVVCVPAIEAEVDQPLAHAPEIRQVLATTDFSELANKAVAHAYALVQPGGTVHLCYVHERPLPSPAYAYDAASTAGIAGSVREKEIEAELRALVPAFAEARAVKTNVVVVDGGRAATAILQTAERLGVDAICLASHGRTGLGKAVLGSVASAVMEAADRPVYVVRGRDR